MRLSTMSMHIYKGKTGHETLYVRVQCSTVNCKTLYIYIVGFQVMETLLLEDDAKLEQARAGRAKTICWATARMYRLSSG